MPEDKEEEKKDAAVNQAGEPAVAEKSELDAAAESSKDEKEDDGAEDAEIKRTKEAQQALKQPVFKRIFALLRVVNVYFIAFLVIMGVAVLVIFVALNTESQGPTLTGQDLTQEQLDELLQQETNIGDVTQTLTVEANAIFNGRVLIKDNLDVAGSISVNGPLTLPGITVSGTSSFDSVEVTNDLAVLGSSSIQGSLSVNESLTVNGNASIGGDLTARSLTVNTINFSSDLQLSRHIDTGGPSPAISAGGSVGGGGTVSISGTDTSGTVTINTGGGPSAGTLASITFANAFSDTPQVVISPVGASGATLNYYVTRTASGFTVGSQNSPAGATTFVFDYWASQ